MSLRDDLLAADTDAEKAAVLDAAVVAVNAALAAASAIIAVVSAIPAEDPGDGLTIWNDAGVLKVSVAE